MMLRSTYIILMIACLCDLHTNAQPVIVLNKQGQPLPMTNVVSIRSGKGTITDDKGKFDRSLFPPGDTIALTHIAYERQLIVTDLIGDTIFMTLLTKDMNPVVIYNWSAFNRDGSVGYQDKKSNGAFGISPGVQLATFIKPTHSATCWLQSVTFSFRNTVSCKGKARVRLMGKDVVKGCPGRDLLDEPLVVDIDKITKNWTINLASQHFIIPHEGLFVVIEMLTADEACMGISDFHSKEKLWISSTMQSEQGLLWINFRDRLWSELGYQGDRRRLLPRISVNYKYQ